jgi:alkyl sulfatase BDS1-like metallo-beta-lactamase superfamily hydrolase
VGQRHRDQDGGRPRAGGHRQLRRSREDLRSGAPLHAAIYTHGHVDHACGLPPFLAEATEKGWPADYDYGWYDGTPSHLKPAPEAELGREIAALAGGVGALVARARSLASAGDLRLASHLIDWAAAAEPESREAHEARAEIYRARAAASEALMTRGIFAASAEESAGRARGATADPR